MNQTVSGRWNGFQRTMLQWNALHPYNAVHVLRLSGPVDLERLRWVVNAVVEQRGLTGFMPEPAGYRYAGGALQGTIRQLPAGGDALGTLNRAIEAQLNTPFTFNTPGDPFRFFVMIEPAGAWLALVYFHSIADAEGIVRLLRDIATAYRDPTRLAGIERWNRVPERHDLTMLRRPGLLLRWLAGLPRAIRSARSSHRPAYCDHADHRNGFRFFALPPPTLPRLLALAKSWGVTLNDLFLAAILLAVSPWAKARFDAPRRRLVSVASIVNTRRELGVASQSAFGLALGSLRVAHEVPPGVGFEAVARAVQAQTDQAKRSRSFLATPLQLAVARFLFERSSPARRQKFYPKHQPLCAGLTNLNLNALWKTADAGAPPDYFRAVSTGPATPLVFSITTAGDRLNVGVSYRPTVFLNSDLERVQDDFQHLLLNAVLNE
jgi:NRPS condensation-like uncharacterized protein